MSRPDHPLFFSMADGVLRRVGVPAGFYLHKNERGALPGDDIDFAVLGTVAGSHDPVTERSDVINGQDLGSAAECQKAMEKKRKRHRCPWKKRAVTDRAFFVVGAVCDRASASQQWQIAYLTRIRPVFRGLNQSGAHGIVPNIEPLLVIKLLGSNDMIEEAFLPVRGAKSRVFKGLRDRVFQRLHPA